MGDYTVVLGEQPREFLSAVDDKTERIVTDNLGTLEEPHPRPGAGRGDREKLVVDGEEVYRLHIGRTWTALYVIDEDSMQAKVFEILDIDEAHKRYGR